jgi:hypothetical protein
MKHYCMHKILTQEEQELGAGPHFLDGVQLSKQNLHELPLGHTVPGNRNPAQTLRKTIEFKNL